jgi:hypothetical protein
MALHAVRRSEVTQHIVQMVVSVAAVVLLTIAMAIGLHAAGS